MTKIFISHSSKEDPAGESLRDWLADKEQGHEPFLDHDLNAGGIVAGQDWEQTLYTELRRCRALIVLLSDDWLRSPWCVAEANYAQALRKPVITVAIAKVSEEIAKLTPPVLRRDQGIRALWPAKEAQQRLLRALEEAGLDHRTGQALKGRAPYPGLPAFTEEDAPFFFARDDDVSRVAEELDRLRAPKRERLLVIQGASGTGKSSILRAGLLPRLKRTPDRWIVLPPLRPLRSGPSALHETLSVELGGDLQPPVPPESWGAWLVATTNRLRAQLKRPEATVVLSIDQLEEALAGEINPQGDALLLAVRDALALSDHRLLVIATLRADFIGALDRHPASRELAPGADDVLPTGRFTVQPLSRSGLFEVIRRPAELVGLRFDDGLIERLVAETGNEDAMPLLAFALRKLWDDHGEDDLHITTKEYATFGGIEKAVGNAAEQVLTRLHPSAAALTAFRTLLLFRLADIAQNGRATRLAIQENSIDPAARAIVDAFVEARLLLAREATIEVAHEALFRNWEQLRDWITETRDDLAAKSRIRAAFETWQQASAADKPGRLLATGLQVEEGRPLLALHGILTEPELRDFVKASVDAEDLRIDNENVRQREKLAQAERLAEEQTKRADAEAASAEERRKQVEAAERAAKSERDLANRRRWQTRAAVAGLAVALGLVGLAGWQWRDATAAKVVAEEQRMRAEQQTAQAQTARVEADEEARRANANLAEKQKRESLRIAGRAIEQSRDGAGPESVRLALYALPRNFLKPERPILPEAVASLHALLGRFRLLDVFESGASSATSAAFSPDGAWIVTGHDDGTAWVWRTDGIGKPIVLRGHEEGVTSVDFSPDGTRIATGSWDKTARVWRADGKFAPTVLNSGESKVESVAFSPDGTRIVVGSGDGTTIVWRTDGTDEPVVLLGGGGPVAFSPDGTRIATGYGDEVKIWRSDGKFAPTVLRAEAGPVLSVAFDSVGERVIAGYDDGTARIWPGTGAIEPPIVIKHAAAVRSVAFSPSGYQVITASGHSARWGGTDGSSGDSTARLWDADGSRDVPRVVLRGHADGLNAAAFSSDGKRIVTVSDDGSVRVWRAGWRDEPNALIDHEGKVSLSEIASNLRLRTVRHDPHTNSWVPDVQSSGSAALDVFPGLFNDAIVDNARNQIIISNAIEKNVVGVLPILSIDALVAEACRLAPDDLTDEQKQAFFITDEEPVCGDPAPAAGNAAEAAP